MWIRGPCEGVNKSRKKVAEAVESFFFFFENGGDGGFLKAKD